MHWKANQSQLIIFHHLPSSYLGSIISITSSLLLQIFLIFIQLYQIHIGELRNCTIKMYTAPLKTAFLLLTLGISTITGAPTPVEKRALVAQTYNEFQVSSGVGGKALEEVNAKFPVRPSSVPPPPPP
jgi:hypothetical protein